MVFTKEGSFSPKKGDIITFRIDDTVVTHRVTENRNGICTTKGDANKTADPVSVKESQIIGRVVFSLPYLGYVIHFYVPGSIYRRCHCGVSGRDRRSGLYPK